MPEPLLELRDVRAGYGDAVVVDDVSLALPPDGSLAVLGRNGTGKTTLLLTIMGFVPLARGSIRFDGREISRLRTPKIARLGVVRTFQQTHVYRKMDCVQNMQISTPQAGETLRSMLRRPSPAITRQAESLLEFVGLQSKRFLPAGDLSFGQQKLLEFAMALMREPKVLLLDEPTAGINPTMINGLIDRLKRAVSELGVTLFIIEHNMPVIMDLADNIYCLANGRLLAHGRPAEIQNDQRVLNAYLGAHYGSEAA